MKHFPKTSVLIISTLLLAYCASNPPTHFASPTPFEASSYCALADRTAPLNIPQSITTILKQDDHSASEDEIAEALLTKAAMQVAHKSVSNDACISVFTKGQDLFLKILKSSQKNLSKAGSFTPSDAPEILDIQSQITDLWREDQSARGAYVGLSTKDRAGPAFWAQRLATAHATRIDSQTKPYIEDILEKYDWIDTVRFGKKVSAHAWILVQHADDHPDFQAHVLKRMEPYLKTGGVKPANYAYLWDRVAVNTGRKQRYGTQPNWKCTEDGKLTLQPLEEPDSVDARRASMNMGTVEAGLAQMAQGICK